MDYTQITYARDGVLGVVTMSRPEKLNAWTPRMAEEMAHAFGVANNDPDVACIVLTGEGRGFCAGADMQETFKSRLDGTDPGNDTAGGSGGLPAGLDWIGLVRSSKPMIAAVNGPAVGIGVTQILPFDVIIAADDAKFGLVFVKVGIVPELASSHYAIARMGFARTSEMMLSGKIYTGSEVAEFGLANYAVPKEQLWDKVHEVAAMFADNPQPMMRMTKQLLSQNMAETDMTLVQRRETDALKECWTTPEHHEAVDAFLNKRDPDFKRAALRGAAE
ncbi:enoyl-CoA hydratase/isomerase family protein [Pyruvatibacter sp.]|uniref:enoyl-CoA hydratase/isomerase family protein n=1 Tax=Pyruvatibacter sp. TaxID=1981328 RepID=UPI0032ECF056